MQGKLITDTSNFFSIDRGDIVQLNGRSYRVTGHERERRFGVEDPKFWVKRVVDTETGEKKIIKLSYFETFKIHLGGVPINFFRSPSKEGEILDLVKDHPGFMHGTVHRDVKNNNIRILDIVPGDNFFVYIGSLTIGHEDYYYNLFPDILKKIIKAFEAIRFLHVNGFKHGDVRNDHIIVERDTGNYVWIDFDYDYDTAENPFSLDILGLGNILLYAIGKGLHNLHMIDKNTHVYGDLRDRVEPGDFSILNRRRLTNLRKLYPYIPVTLNEVLGHFSRGAEIYYESVDEIIEDLNRCLYSFY